MVEVQKPDFEAVEKTHAGPAQAPVILKTQEHAQRLAQIGIDRGMHRRIDPNEARLTDGARLHWKKNEGKLREMVIKGEDWKGFIRKHEFYPPSVQEELIRHMKIVEQCALTGRVMGALATGMKPGEWKTLPEEQRQDAVRVARHAAATIQEYAKKNNISVDAAFDTLLKDDKFRGALVAVGSPAFKAKDDAMRAAHGLTTDEGEKAKWMKSAGDFVAGQARAAGFKESTIKAAFADPTGLLSLGAAVAPSISLSSPAAVQMAQQQMMNVQMQRKDEERRERDELSEKLNEKERKKAALKKIAGESEKAA